MEIINAKRVITIDLSDYDRSYTLCKQYEHGAVDLNISGISLKDSETLWLILDTPKGRSKTLLRSLTFPLTRPLTDNSGKIHLQFEIHDLNDAVIYLSSPIPCVITPSITQSGLEDPYISDNQEPSLTDRVEAQEKSITTFQRQAESLNIENESLKESMREIAGKVQVVEESLGSFGETLESVQDNLCTLSDDLDHIEIDLGGVQEEQEGISEQVSEIAGSLAAEIARNSLLQGNIEERFGNIEIRLGEVEGKYGEVLEELKESASTLQAALEGDNV